MKRGLFAVCCLFALAVWAGGYTSNAMLQFGNGTNGMTFVTDGGPLGAPALTGGFLASPGGQCGRVTLRAQADQTFQNASDLSWMRTWHYGPDARGGGACLLNRVPQYDFEVDAGQSGKAAFGNTFTYNVGPLPIAGSSCAETWFWAGENLQQSTTLDAGVDVLVELTTGSNACN